ncbi:MAG: molybdopterin-binding protein [Caldilineaceae bacterium]
MAIRTGILCVPQLDEDATAALVHLLRNHTLPIIVIHEAVAASHRNWIEEILRRWCDEDELDLILTVGGTMPASGPSSREIAPEVTQLILERSLPGLSEAMRAYGREQSPLALLDRGVCGIRGQTLIINLPTGAAASVLFLEAIVDLIPSVLSHLQGESTAPILNNEVELIEQDDAPDSDLDEVRENNASGLSIEEFAKFLQRGKKQE